MPTPPPRKLFTVTIADCRVDTFRSGGKGGQHQNKTDSGVRIVHEPSGAIGECRETRSQLENKRIAFQRMGASPQFQRWAKIRAAQIMGHPTIEERVENLMQPHHLKIEQRGPSGTWIVADPHTSDLSPDT